MIVFTFAAHYINYSNLFLEFTADKSLGFWDAVRQMPAKYFVPEYREFRRKFFGYLWLLYLYVFVGCVPFIVSLFRKKRTENQIATLGKEEEE